MNNVDTNVPQLSTTSIQGEMGGAMLVDASGIRFYLNTWERAALTDLARDMELQQAASLRSMQKGAFNRRIQVARNRNRCRTTHGLIVKAIILGMIDTNAIRQEL